LHRTSIVSKTLFVVPTDAHYYKIIEMLKQFKIITLTPTCFGSRRNHHQGAVLYLAKTTNMVFLCSSIQTQSMLWRHINLLCTTCSRGVRMSGSNAGYTMFRGSAKGTGYPHPSPVSPSLPLPCVTVCNHVSSGLCHI